MRVKDESSKKPELLSRLQSEFGFIQGNFLLLLVSWLILDFCAELPATYFSLYIADRYGRKWIIMTMTALAGLSRLIYIFAPTWEWLVLGAAVMGFTGIYTPALEAMIADSIPRKREEWALV